jgi:hypothetical protein
LLKNDYLADLHLVSTHLSAESETLTFLVTVWYVAGIGIVFVDAGLSTTFLVTVL